jgi:ElaB/YqjD/DUF883 family membrane-anchored ribosome-binding protein
MVVDTEDLIKATAGDRRAHRCATPRIAAQRRTRPGDGARSAVAVRTRRWTGVRENPWTAIGVAAGIGLVVGILLGRK